MVRKRSGTTKEKLLAAASDVFVEMGFRDATVAEICARAEANISAVNYYFGSKEALYQEAWRHSFNESIKAYPQDGGVNDAAPLEEQLHGQIKALIKRIADDNNKDFFISQMEMINPTGLLEEVMKTELIPLREKTLSIVLKLLGNKVTAREVSYCETCIISMCVHPMLMQRIMRRNSNMKVHVIDDLDAFADHVIKFALAGIAAIREKGLES
jgi:TetR/AcrR family transcriptional regulator, regulator of cefoperazone and chloramphenicol sensitivity